MEVLAWQRRLRERKSVDEPRVGNRTLAGYTVSIAPREEAQSLVAQYEWLGTLGGAVHFVGLWCPRKTLEGVACFGIGPGWDIRKVIGSPALCLERGACVHWAPPNAASFLISRACRLVSELTGVSLFYAYGDPQAGEYGAVYQAASWVYLGQGICKGKERSKRLSVLPPGKDPENPGHWTTTRILRSPKRRLSLPEAKRLGWLVTYRDAKHVYAQNLGPKKRAWLKAIGGGRPYPKPRPHLKEDRTSNPWAVETEIK